MNAILLDTCVAHAAKNSFHIETTLSESYLEMVKTICGTVVCVVGLIIAGFLVYKLIEHIANNASEHRKRKNEVEDIERATQAKLRDRLLDFLKDIDEQKYKEELKGFLSAKHKRQDK